MNTKPDVQRWYEKHTILNRHIELMRDLDEERRDQILVGLMKLIKERSPTLLDDFVDDFPMEIHRKRWYDQDPYLWLIINGLQYGSDELISEVESYLVAEIGELPRPSQQASAR